jgi:hypothetical protein
VRVEILRGLGDVSVLADVSRVLVLADDGTPLAVASEWTPGMIIVRHAGEAKFQETLAGLGVDRTVVATPLKVRPMV